MAVVVRTHTGEMQAATVIDQMNRDLYEAVVKGNVEDYHKALQELQQMPEEEARRRQVTPKGNTVLHVAAIHGHEDLVERILEDAAMSSLLFAKNKRNESALHCAAEKGYDGIVSVIISATLHAAILSGFGYSKMSNLIQAVAFPYTNGEFATECTHTLLKKKICLCEETDMFGWTPLHYAIKIENDKAVCIILEKKASAAYICAGDNDEWTTIFHIAARHDKVEMMKEISKWCPDCWEMVNSKGQNVLHEAILSNKLNVIRHIEENSDQFENLVIHKDKDGNTPLHLLADAHHNILQQFITERPMLNYFAFNKKHQTLFDMTFLERNKLLDIWYKALEGLLIADKNRLPVWETQLVTRVKIWKMGENDQTRLLLHSRKFADRMIQNSEHRVNIPTEEKRLEDMIGTAKTSIVVATLILTMTFAAGITVLGGYHQDKGYPLLLRNTAFKAFIITNTFAFLCSFCSIAVHIAMVSQASRGPRSFKTVAKLNDWQTALLGYSSYGVGIAFLCAMYATLAPLRLLAIFDLILGVFFVSFGLSVYNLYFATKKLVV